MVVLNANNSTIRRDIFLTIYFSNIRYLDFLNLMTYDLRGPSDEMASHHSALYSGHYEEGEQKVFNQVSFVYL